MEILIKEGTSHIKNQKKKKNISYKLKEGYCQFYQGIFYNKIYVYHICQLYRNEYF